MTTSKCPVTHLTMNNGAPVADNQNSLTAGARGPLLAQDLWLNENSPTSFAKSSPNAVCTPKVRARSVRLP